MYVSHIEMLNLSPFSNIFLKTKRFTGQEATIVRRVVGRAHVRGDGAVGGAAIIDHAKPGGSTPATATQDRHARVRPVEAAE